MYGSYAPLVKSWFCLLEELNKSSQSGTGTAFEGVCLYLLQYAIEGQICRFTLSFTGIGELKIAEVPHTPRTTRISYAQTLRAVGEPR
jgi:hypothetical protein